MAPPPATAGGARQSGRDEREIELAIYATRHIWPTLKDELGIDPEWRQNGYLCCGYNEDHKNSLEQRIRGGGPVRHRDGDDGGG